ncbi:carbohydrate ABC transporter permease [Paenibacillus radicis (ex Gao et al. 2016)]|uniref:ABC transporter permease n=1 Tax=Paenibacillus radicis (ex Gao et al. 2016) TaxID=1737354 RepID=A0A917LXU8_9BACL|nr:sugar ABC transporter permease [Paenibacillus radicis (ex Gao et al. 2016)]GGG64230.1 ABC transporter permease [Paenibacillus radicis (ex Gao et al. 2016)]
MNKKIFSLDRYTYFLFSLPAVILYSFFFVYAVIVGINYSFTDWNGISKSYNYIGFDNYLSLFKNPNFWQSLEVTGKYALMLVIGVMALSMILALSLNSLKRFKTFTKSVYFLPAMISAVTLSLIWDQMFYRIAPKIGEALNIAALSQSPLASPKYALIAIVLVNIWQAVALPTLIFIAGLQSVPDELYESARIDGASTFKRFRFITMPFLVPTITVNMVLAIKAGVTSFDYAYTLTGGGPIKASNLIGIMIYNDAFQNMKFAMANAESVVLFVIIAVLSFVQIWLSRKGGVNGK